MKAVLNDIEYQQQRCPTPKEHQKQHLATTAPMGIVTYLKVGDTYHVLSRYEYDVWRFPLAKTTAGKKECDAKLNFARIAKGELRDMAKWVIWQQVAKGAAVGSCKNKLDKLVSYFNWMSQSTALIRQGLTAFTAQGYVAHVNTLTVKRKGEVKPLASMTKTQKFLAVEDLYQYCREFDFVNEHPWVDSSAAEQADFVGEVRNANCLKPKTPIIPDTVLIPLCQYTKGYLDNADTLLNARDNGDGSVKNEDLTQLRDSCLFWILLTTGMRIHEVCGIKRGDYRTETKDDETFYYVKSVSDKTEAGYVEWIAPKIAIDAIKVLERYSLPLQHELSDALVLARANNDAVEIDRLSKADGAIGLSKTRMTGKINTLSATTITYHRLPKLCTQLDLDWNLAAHQFRRTFANYVVHSELGDLRALKEHFKHWSIKMTVLYAFNEALDLELFEELLREKAEIEQDIKSDWFGLDTPLAGGAVADKIIEVRSDDDHVKTFKSREDMVKAYTGTIPIRSTGIAWCTNDEEGSCNGKCNDCYHGVIDSRHAQYWKGVLFEQLALCELTDIGEAGLEGVRKGLANAEAVLKKLGHDVEKFKLEYRNKNQLIPVTEVA